MKFFTLILSLFTVSFVYSASTTDQLIKKCKSELKEYSTCIFDYKKIQVKELNSYCKTFNSTKCKNFIESPEKYIPSCYSLPNDVRIEDTVLLFYKRDLIKMICGKDENGKNCAYSDVLFNENKISNVSYVKSIVEKTCNSPICLSTYIDLLESQISVGKEGLDVKYGLPRTDVNSLREMLNYVSSNKCHNKKNTSTSIKKTINNVSKKATTTTKKATVTPKKSSTAVKKTTTKSTKKSTSTVSGRCGVEFGGACPKSNYCCSKYGYCGTSEDHCGSGCQSEFGKCNNSKSNTKKSTKSTKKITTTKKTTTIKKVTTTKKTTKKSTTKKTTTKKTTTKKSTKKSTKK